MIAVSGTCRSGNPTAAGTCGARWFGGGSTHEDWLIYDRARFRDRPLPI
jgi:hypothetical protein